MAAFSFCPAVAVCICMCTGAAKKLNAGGIGVIPTDTLFGVVARAHDAAAVERIYALKGRDENKPFIVLVDSIDRLAEFGIALTDAQRAYLDSVWPGPVSVILPCPDERFAYLHRGTQAIAFRMPKLRWLRRLIRRTGPLVAPSANPQGIPPARTVREAKKYFGAKADFYMWGMPRAGKASKVVSLVSDEPVVIRA